jgi:hypothetical protein
MERASIQSSRIRRAKPNEDEVQREVETATAPMETQATIELKANAKKLHKQAQTVEERWRTAHGIDTKLRGKHQVEAKRKRQRLERGEGRQLLARPLLKGVMVMTRES